jgi:hypothetical protein
MIKSFCFAGALSFFAITPLSGLVAQSASPGASRQGTTPSAGTPEIGMPVFSIDGQKIGTVESVNMSADGKVTAINITTGSILGFGLKLVGIPPSKLTVIGQHVRVEMTADDIAVLPDQGP